VSKIYYIIKECERRKKTMENNVACLAGEIDSEFQYSHTVQGEAFYLTTLLVERLSGQKDRLPVLVSERLMDVRHSYREQTAAVTGQIRSYNRWVGKNRKLELFVFAREVMIIGAFLNREANNQIVLDGYLCKEAVFRGTPLGRKIADLSVAVNRSYGKSDYIPCICWGRNAGYAAELPVGSRVQITGRFQSREYEKKLDDGSVEIRTAYEVSVNRLEIPVEVGRKQKVWH